MQVAVGFSIYLTTINFAKESSSENIFKSVQIWRNYGHESVAPLFFSPPCIHYSASQWGSGVLWWACPSVCVYVFVCPRSYLRNYTSDLHYFFAHAACVRGSVCHWRCIDTLRISGFVVIFHSRLKTFLFCRSVPPQPSFSSSELTPRIPRTVCRYFWAYPFFYFLVFLFLHFLVVRSVR